MNIYFCGSIRGGREDAARYARIIGLLKGYGRVLTEHVGNPSLTGTGDDGEDGAIWRQDTGWLRESDLVIADCSRPSLGVGYELALAESLGKRVHVFYGGPAGRLSAMISGDPYFTVHLYQNEEELFQQLQEVMKT